MATSPPAVSVEQEPRETPAVRAGRRPVRRHRDLWVLLAAAVAVVLLVLAIHAWNGRSYVGYHGLPHTAITRSVLRGEIPPQNPYATGLALPYYWTFHLLLAGLTHFTGGSVLAACQIVTIASLLVALFAAAWWSKLVYGQARFGVLPWLMGLLAVNVVGPFVLLARWLMGSSITFSLDAFTRSPLHPCLRASMPGQDVRWGPNLFLFLQPSSRPAAFASALLAAAMLGAHWRRPSRLLLVGIVMWLVASCSFNPVVGVGAACSLAGGFVLATLVSRDGTAMVTRRAAAVLVTLLSAPILAWPLFSGVMGATSAGLPFERVDAFLLLKLARLALLAVVPLAFLSLAARGRAWRADPAWTMMAAAGVLLLLLATVGHVRGGREHSFFNLAVLFLAWPAAGWLLRPDADADSAWESNPTGTSTRLLPLASRPRTGLLFLLIAPMTAILLFSFLYRRPIDLRDRGSYLVYENDQPREELYHWIRTCTAVNTIVVIDPREKPWSRFYGSESEIPAFTGRSLYVDHESWLFWSVPEAAERRGRVPAVFDGSRPVASLDDGRLPSNRPLLLLSRNARKDGVFTEANRVVRFGQYAAVVFPPIDAREPLQLGNLTARR